MATEYGDLARLAEIHSHGRYEHAHAHHVIPHSHLVRALCDLPECDSYPTHNVHPDGGGDETVSDGNG